MSFYDWYCDLPPSSPQTWGEQTDVPESADWYNSGFLILWGSNVPQTRTPDAHFYTEARYNGAKSVVICPDYSEASKFADLWISVKQGTDAALAMAMGHVILREFHLDRQAQYFDDYVRQYTDMPMLVRLVKQDGRLVPERLAARLRLRRRARRDQQSGMEDGRLRRERRTRSSCRAARSASAGARRASGISRRRTPTAATTKSAAHARRRARTTSPTSPSPISATASTTTSRAPIIRACWSRKVPAKRVALKDGEALVATVFDLFVANYGVDRGFGGEHVAKSLRRRTCPTRRPGPRAITGVPRDQIITVAREFALNAEKTKGRSMVIIGAAMNHWYHWT